MMKRLLAILAAAALISGCGAAEETGGSGKITVISTIFPSYDFTRELAGDRAEAVQLLPAGAESHTFEPAPRDMIAISESDLFIYTGGESDVWIEDILASMGEDAPETLRLIDCVEPLAAEISEGMQAGHSHDGEDGHAHEAEYDEHVWTSPKNAAKIAAAIAGKLKSLDSANAGYYDQRLADYTARLNKLDASLSETISGAQRRMVVVGDRFPFLYLAEHYGLEYYAAFPACGGEGDASAATVAFLTEMVKQNGIPAVLYIEFSNHQVADAIAESASVETALLHSCHNVSAAELESGASYLTLMEGNIATLQRVLN